jgi:hypothetical protein
MSKRNESRARTAADSQLGYFVLVLLLWPRLVDTACAQPAPNVSVTGVGLLSIQPADNQYAGTPYLINGLGGIGSGFALGVNLRVNRRVVLLAEYSTAWVANDQSGRLLPEGHAVGRLRDGVVTGLLGIAWRQRPVIIQSSAGIGVLVRALTSGDVPVTTESGRIVLVPGLDVIRSLSRRMDLVGSGRGYLFATRNVAETNLGIGEHFVRFGAGIRLRLGEQ